MRQTMFLLNEQTYLESKTALKEIIWSLPSHFFLRWVGGGSTRQRLEVDSSRGVHIDFRVCMKRLESIFVRSITIIFFYPGKTFSWLRRGNFSTSCLTENSSSFFGYTCSNEFQALAENRFLSVRKWKFSGIVYTVLKLSSDESQVIWEPKAIDWWRFWALIWWKWLESLELTSWILSQKDCHKIPGQDLASSER